MDAPAHFLPAEEHRTIDQVRPGEMVAEGVVFDFTDKPPGGTITGPELRERADRHGLAAGEYAILDCGMTPADTDAYLREYVYPDGDAAAFLVERGVACLASDGLNVDPDGVPFEDHVVHRTLLPADVLIVEGVANLERVPAGRVDVVCTPLPYVGRDGSQVRLLLRPQ